MKCMVRWQVSVEAGKAIEARAGGPAPVMGRVMDRFKPECVYMSPIKRELFMVCELSPQDMTELMIIGSNLAGAYPEVIPVITGQEFGGVVGKAMPAAHKILEG